MNVVAGGAWNVTEMRRMRIWLVRRGLGREVLISAVAFHADRLVRRLRRRTFAVTRAAIEPRRKVLVDEKAMAAAGCRYRLPNGVANGRRAKKADRRQGDEPNPRHHQNPQLQGATCAGYERQRPCDAP